MPSIELRDVARWYRSPGAPPVPALRGIDLRLDQGEFVAITGPSGGGKSTLLSIIGLLDAPTSGEYLLDGRAVSVADNADSSGRRAREFGFVFQDFHLLDRRPVIESVELG